MSGRVKKGLSLFLTLILCLSLIPTEVFASGDAPGEAAEVRVSFRCGQLEELSGLFVYDADGLEQEPCYDEASSGFCFDTYYLAPGQYTYTLHDSSGRYRDLTGVGFSVNETDSEQTVTVTLSEAEGGDEPDGAEVHSDTVVNPIYEDVLSEEDIPTAPLTEEDYQEFLVSDAKKPLFAFAKGTKLFGASAAGGTVYHTDLASAGAELRKGLKEKTAEVNIYFQSDEQLSWSELHNQIFSQAVIHTGAPTEGDYLYYQYGGYSVKGYGPKVLEGGSEYSYLFRYTLKYLTTAVQERQMDDRVSSVLGTLGLGEKTEYQKIKAIYDYLCSNVTYDNAHLNDNTYTLKYTGYAALVNGTALCQGYAVAFYRLCLEAGIDSRVISSTAMWHAWNIVKFFDNYYEMDATWDAGRTPYRYFLKGSTYWLANHRYNGISTTGDQYEDEDFAENYPLPAANAPGVYTVRYDANGGTGAPKSQEKYENIDITLSSAKPEREYYTFMGWATSETASTAKYKPGDTFSLNANTVLYAVWSPKGVLIGSDISADTVWSNTAKPYILTADITVGYGAALELYEGVTVDGNGHKLTVLGTLSAEGAEINGTSVLIGRTKDTEPAAVRLTDCTFSGGSLLNPTGNESYAVTELKNNRFTDLSGYICLRYPAGETYITGNVFERCGGISVGSESNVFITDNLFFDHVGTDYVIENWYQGAGSCCRVEKNSFYDEGVVLRLAQGYSEAGMNASGNYWFTADEAVISGRIADSCDGQEWAAAIEFLPVLTSPDEGSPTFTGHSNPENTFEYFQTAAPTCCDYGCVEHWECPYCGRCFLKNDGNNFYEVSRAEISIAPVPHTVTEEDCTAESAPTCMENGNIEFRRCEVCGRYFSDEECRNEISAADTVIPALGHDFETEGSLGICTRCGITDGIRAFSGKCSESISWLLNSEGVLKVSGTGVIPDYSEAAPSPWASHGGSIEHIELGQEITRIGDYAFSGCTGLGAFCVPSTVRSIGTCAFSDCTGLNSVAVRSDTVMFEGAVFSGCEQLGSAAFDCMNAPRLETVSDESCGTFWGLTGITVFYPEKYASGWINAAEQELGCEVVWTVCCCIDAQGTVITDHSPVLITGTPATETEDGLSDYTGCSVCKMSLSKQTVLPATGWAISYELSAPEAVNSPDNPRRYYKDSDDISLRAPSRSGFSFAGWYLDSGLTQRAAEPQISSENSGSITFYAKWSPNTYELGFDPNGGKGKMAGVSMLPYDEEYILETSAYTRSGYAFTGWSLEADGEVRYADGETVSGLSAGNGETVTLNACWEKLTYSVTYESNGGTNADSNPGEYCVDSEKISLADPVRSGYSFAGWYKDSAFKSRVSAIGKGSTGDMTLYAKWTPVKYTIKYDLGKGTNAKDAPSSYTADTALTRLPVPTRKGYAFTGWYTEAELINRIETVGGGMMGNLMLYAGWQEESYTVSYVLNGGENDPANITAYKVTDATFKLLGPVSAPDGAKFAGWYRDPVFKSKVTGISKGSAGDITLYARWTAPGIPVSYVLNGGRNAKTNPGSFTKYSPDIALEEPTCKGYAFEGWFTDAEFGTPIDTIAAGSTEPLTLYAKWSKITYNISYELGGGENDPENITGYVITDASFKLRSPTVIPAGYTFGGWYKDAAFKSRVSSVSKGSTGDMTLYAKWTPIRYSVRYSLDKGTNAKGAPTSYTVQTAESALPAPARKGYDFAGWYTEAEHINRIESIGGGMAENVAVYAKWERTEYSVRYVLRGGTAPTGNPDSYTVDTATIKLAGPTRTGYTFGGWYKDAALKSKISSISKGSTGDLTLYAKWTANSYTVSFNGSGSRSGKTAAVKCEYGTVYKLPENGFVKPGYEFIGWNTSPDGSGAGYCDCAEILNLTATAKGRLTLYAMWRQISAT